jgi:uncharacterized protein
MTRLSPTDAAAVAAHYGSISIVTFVTATSVLQSQGIAAEGYMVAVAAAMEAPAIVSALWLVSRAGGRARMDAGLWREILLNGSIVLLVGAFLIGCDHRGRGLARSTPSSSRRSRACCACSCWTWGWSPGAACGRARRAHRRRCSPSAS